VWNGKGRLVVEGINVLCGVLGYMRCFVKQRHGFCLFWVYWGV
jgi:hypothetical protein